MSNKESFFRVINKIEDCKKVICVKEEDVDRSMKKYRSMIHDSSEACTEKAINLCIFAVVQVLCKELDRLNDAIDKIIDEVDVINEELDNINSDNQEE